MHDEEQDKELDIVDVDSSGNGDLDGKEKSVKNDEKVVEWAYNVMDWLCCAVEAKAYKQIYDRLEDIITAFLVLVKDEHRGIVMDTFKKILSRVKG